MKLAFLTISVVAGSGAFFDVLARSSGQTSTPDGVEIAMILLSLGQEHRYLSLTCHLRMRGKGAFSITRLPTTCRPN